MNRLEVEKKDGLEIWYEVVLKIMPLTGLLAAISLVLMALMPALRHYIAVWRDVSSAAGYVMIVIVMVWCLIGLITGVTSRNPYCTGPK